MVGELEEVSPDEQILAHVVRELERSPDGSPEVERILREHPHLRSEVRDLEALHKALDQSRGQLVPPLPERLGEFRIVRRLETGGMGEVFEAWQEPLHRRVAVKVLRHGQHSDVALDRFMREQRVLAQLHQTNIVPIHTAGREGPVEYFAMPFIDGAALRHVVQAAAEFSSGSPGTKTPSIAGLIGHTRDARVELAEAPAPAPPDDSRVVPPRRPEFRPSIDYLRSVARVMADAAQAVQHAHDKGVHHRDIKPSNIMVETHATADGSRADQCWVIDFGLASYRGELAPPPAGPPTVPPGRTPAANGQPTMSSVVGTPAYMAPEQFGGRAGALADVWGLGVTLYELLTLRQPFVVPDEGSEAARLAAVREQVCHQEPPRPRGLIPRDLEAICFKALRKKPAQRYACAQDLADDLRRWLRGEVAVALREEAPSLAVPLRCGRWARRNKGWAAALVGLAAVVLIGFLAVESGRRAAERAVRLQELELASAQPRMPGWSKRARTLAASLAEQDDDDRLREAFVATLEGLDAHELAARDIRASALAFDDRTGELLIGGDLAVGTGKSALPALPARSWRTGADPQECGLALPGPVACRPDGTRVQFVHDPAVGFRSWDMGRGVPLVGYPLPGAAAGWVPVTDELGLPVLALSADGSAAAAAVKDPARAESDDEGLLVAWDALSGHVIAALAMPATALALAADGSYLAAGDAAGQVTAWHLPSGDRAAEVVERHDSVQSLAFGTHPGGARSTAAGRRDFLLAIGCPSGRVDVWDSRELRLRTGYRGMSHRTYALAFSPDGTLLAGAGAIVKLWDSATGEALLTVPGGHSNAVAFSADGRLLALTNYVAHRGGGGVTLMRLEHGRGIDTLRGLDKGVKVVAFSHDGERLAVLSGDWRVAVWDCASRTQLFVRDAPRGVSADNVGLAFSPDGAQLVCVTGEEARSWDAATGAALRPWSLPRGMSDKVAFDQRGDLIVARSEPIDPAATDLRKRAVCRVRNLSRTDTLEPLFEIRDFDVLIVSLVLDPRGRWVVIEGDSSGASGMRRAIKAFEIPSGNPLWNKTFEKKEGDVASLHIDPTGQFVSYTTRDVGSRVLVDVPSGRVVDASGRAKSLGPGGQLLINSSDSSGAAGRTEFTLRGRQDVLLRLRHDLAEFAVVDLPGKRVAIGQADGTIQLLDLAEIGERLEAVGLDW